VTGDEVHAVDREASARLVEIGASRHARGDRSDQARIAFHEPPTADPSILETHFDWASVYSDWDRIHALIDPICAGLPRLIREYNQQFPLVSASRLKDPDHTLEIPCFPS
jgi:hypothetical protein